MTELATTYVRIRPRTTGFKQEADTKLKQAKPDDLEVQVSADTRTAEERLTLLKDRLDTLRSRVAEARVKLDGDDRSLGKLAELDAAMIRLDKARANPKIDLEGVARAEGQISALNVQLDKLAAKERLAGRGGAGGGFLGRLGGYASKGGGFFGGLPAALVAGSAASVPLGIGALGAGASFLTPAVAGTAGLGLFGAASKSAITRVTAVEKKLTALDQRIANTPATNPGGSPAQIAAAQARLVSSEASLRRAQYLGGTARISSAQASVASARSSLESAQGGGPNKTYQNLVKQREQLLSKLTPAEHHAAEGIERLEKSWVKFQRAVEPETFKATAVGTGILSRGLHDLLPMTKAVGDEVVDLEKRASKALQDPFWQHFFGVFLTREAPRAVDSLGTTLGNVVEGIARLSERFAPLGHDLEDFLTGTSRGFDKWTSGGGPAKFVALVEKDGPIAAHALHGLARGLEGLGKGLEPIGRVELQALTPVLEFIGKLGDEHPAVITALGVAYLSVAGGLKAIAAVKGISEVVGVLTGGRVGTGGAGRLGGFSGSLSSPVPVYVTNWGGKGVFPGGGKGVSTAEAGEGGAATGIATRTAARLGLTGITRLAGPLALTYAATAGGDQNKAQVGTNRAFTNSNIPSGVAGALQSLVAGLPASGNYFTGAIDSPNRKVDLNAIAQATINSGSSQQRELLDQLATKFAPLESVLSGLQSELRLANMNPNVVTGGRGLGSNMNPNVEHGGQVVNYNLYNPTFTNVSSPQALGRALQSQQRLRALSGVAPQGQRRAADFYG